MTDPQPPRPGEALDRGADALADDHRGADALAGDHRGADALAGDHRGADALAIDLRQLVAAAAHEIRNPLNTMAIHCELLESRLRRPGGAPPDPDARDALLRSIGSLSKEIDRIDRTLAQFLRHAGPRDLERETINADAWLAQVVTQARAAAEAAGVTIHLNHPRLGRWNVDGESLGRAVQAVLENAVLATPRGGAVAVTARAQQDRGEVCIRDSGPGIPADVLPLVCHLGFSTRPGHKGLGLAIAKQVVKSQHGGDLRLSSEPGQGTTVTLSVPLEDDV